MPSCLSVYLVEEDVGGGGDGGISVERGQYHHSYFSKWQESDFISCTDMMLLPPIPDTPETRPGSGQWPSPPSQANGLDFGGCIPEKK